MPIVASDLYLLATLYFASKEKFMLSGLCFVMQLVTLILPRLGSA